MPETRPQYPLGGRSDVYLENLVLLLREADRKIRLLNRVARCFTDVRNPQHVQGLALGYQDLNEHEELRRDSQPAVVASKREMGGPLAGKSTLNRLELSQAGSPAQQRYHALAAGVGAE
jgi:hypothetical protein